MGHISPRDAGSAGEAGSPGAADVRGRPLVIGHRGASAAYPENTVEAFLGACALGADWVELDARRSADGVLVVHHDERLPDGDAIASLERAALPPSIPTLAAALAACEGMGVNAEIKHDREDPARRVAAATADLLADHVGDLLVSSFDAEALRVVRRRQPTLPTGALVSLVDDVEGWLDAAVSAGHVAVNPWDVLVDEALVVGAHGRGLRVNVWTVDDPDRMRALAALGVDGIITNVPDVALAALGG